jgi:hypothetical protein
MQVLVTSTVLFALVYGLMSLLCFSAQVNRLGTTTFECEQKQGM